MFPYRFTKDYEDYDHLDFKKIIQKTNFMNKNSNVIVFKKIKNTLVIW